MGTWQRALLVCGIVASVISSASDLVAAALTPGYNFATQSASVLTAPGAQTRTLVLSLNFAANVLVVGFGVGIWRSAEQRRSLRAIGALLIFSAVLQSVAAGFFPFRPAESPSTLANRLNVALMAPSIGAWLLAVLLGAVAFRNWFRYWSIGLLAAWLLEDFLTTAGISLFLGGAHPGSLVGVQERSMGYGFWAWVALLAWVQLRALADHRHPSRLINARPDCVG